MDETFKPIDIKWVADGVRVVRLDAEAELPEKNDATDVGYDLTLMARTDNRVEDNVGDVNMFRTGLCIKPPLGHHVEIIARSSLHKTGYMLANAVGVIDPNYRGEVLVALYKFREGQDLVLPFRAVQLVVRPTVYARILNVSGLDDTKRGSGGFGSTGTLPFKKATPTYYAPEPDTDENGYKQKPKKRIGGNQRDVPSNLV